MTDEEAALKLASLGIAVKSGKVSKSSIGLVISALAGDLVIEGSQIYRAMLARDNNIHQFVDYVAMLDGNEIGKIQVIIDHLDGLLEANNIKVKAEYRHQGVASALYNYASEAQGKKFRPSTSQTADGENLWKTKVSGNV